MLRRAIVQGKGGGVVTVNHFQHKGFFQLRFNTVELHVVLVFNGGLFNRPVVLQQPVTFPLEVHVIVHLQTDIFVVREGKRQDGVRHQFFIRCRTIGR